MLFSQFSVVRVGVGGLGYSGDQTNGPGVCLAGLDGKPWNRFSFVVLAYSGHISCYFSAFFVICFFPGVFGLYKGQALGWEYYKGDHHRSRNTPTTLLPAINISHIFGWPSYVRFYALLLIVLVFGWGGLDTIINGLSSRLYLSPLRRVYSSLVLILLFSDTLFVYYPSSFS